MRFYPVLSKKIDRKKFAMESAFFGLVLHQEPKSILQLEVCSALLALRNLLLEGLLLQLM